MLVGPYGPWFHKTNHGLIGLKAEREGRKDVLSQYESREGLLAGGAEAAMAEARE